MVYVFVMSEENDKIQQLYRTLIKTQNITTYNRNIPNI